MSGESTDGYVKFHARHEKAAPPEHPLLASLDMTRTRLYDLGLVGMGGDGVGYGNLSIRDGEGFIITGSATGGSRELGPDGYCRVLSFDLESNSVASRGPLPASSESMSHGAVYEARPAVSSVIHVHDRGIWRGLLDSGEPATGAGASYGSPAMAKALSDLVRSLDVDAAVIAMAGHEEGIIAYGPDIGSALERILGVVSRFSRGREGP